MKVLGVMSGTSLDGLDLAAIEFMQSNECLAYTFISSQFLPYNNEWKKKLANSTTLSGLELSRLDVEFGRFIGEKVNEFIQSEQLEIDLIASHGHTVFHEPHKGMTLQIGNGNAIKAKTGITTCFDFRSLDVALGGQGAPLVPIGDKLLFAEYDVCLNLGGIANLSYDDNETRMALDVSGCNLVLNHFANELGLEYDENGDLARTGQVDQNTLDQLNNWDYLGKPLPKSLDKQEVLDFYLSKLQKLETRYALTTMCEHIAMQIGRYSKPNQSLLVTGGGALNTYLIERISHFWKGDVVVPDHELINFKEALIFALLGYLRVQNKVNVLSSVTGAKRDSVSGSLV